MLLLGLDQMEKWGHCARQTNSRSLVYSVCGCCYLLAGLVGFHDASLEEMPEISDHLHHVARRLDLPVQIDVLRTFLHQVQQFFLPSELKYPISKQTSKVSTCATSKQKTHAKQTTTTATSATHNLFVELVADRVELLKFLHDLVLHARQVAGFRGPAIDTHKHT